MDKLIVLHNEARGSLPPLQKDPDLMAYAQDWADTMARDGRMRHSSMRNIMKLGFSTAGENIAWGQNDEDAVMRGWLRSPGHRWNIMGRSYNRIGCGASVSNGRIYWCVCFGRRSAG